MLLKKREEAEENFVVPAVDYVMTMHGGIKKCGFCKDLVRSFIRRLILAAGRGGVIHARIDRKKFPQRGVRGEETSAGRVLCLVVREMRYDGGCIRTRSRRI